jgi:hypothetical protein
MSFYNSIAGFHEVGIPSDQDVLHFFEGPPQLAQ